MSDKQVKVILSADSQSLTNAFSKAAQHIKSFGSATGSEMSRVKKIFQGASENIGTFGKALTALSSGYVLKQIFSVKDFMPIDAALLRMQGNWSMNAREIDSFKAKLATLAGEEGENMQQLFSNAEKLSKSYTPNEILKIMKASAMASDAMDADLGAVQDRVIQLMKLYKKTPYEAQGIAEALVASGANFESLDMLLQRSALGGGIGSSYKDSLAFLGGLKKAGFDSSRVMMAVQTGILDIIQDGEKLKKVGIDLFKIDPASGKKVKKNAVEVLETLDNAFKNNPRFNKLGKTRLIDEIDKQWGKGTGAMVYELIGRIDALKAAQKDQGNAAVIAAKQSAAANASWEKQLEKVQGHIDSIKTDFRWLYDLAKKPLTWFAESPKATKIATAGIGGASAVMLGATVIGSLKKIFSATTGKGLPVFVTNPGFGTGGGLGYRDMDFKGKAGWRNLGNDMSFFAKASLVAGVGLAAFEIGAAIEEKWIKGSWGEKIFDKTHSGEISAGKEKDILNARLQEMNKRGDQQGVRDLLNPANLAHASAAGDYKPQNNITIHLQVSDKQIKSTTDDFNTLINVPRTPFFPGPDGK